MEQSPIMSMEFFIINYMIRWMIKFAPQKPIYIHKGKMIAKTSQSYSFYQACWLQLGSRSSLLATAVVQQLQLGSSLLAGSSFIIMIQFVSLGWDQSRQLKNWLYVQLLNQLVLATQAIFKLTTPKKKSEIDILSSSFLRIVQFRRVL